MHKYVSSEMKGFGSGNIDTNCWDFNYMQTSIFLACQRFTFLYHFITYFGQRTLTPTHTHIRTKSHSRLARLNGSKILIFSAQKSVCGTDERTQWALCDAAEREGKIKSKSRQRILMIFDWNTLRFAVRRNAVHKTNVCISYIIRWRKDEFISANYLLFP